MKVIWEFQASFTLRNSPNVSPTGAIYFSAGGFLYAIRPMNEIAPPAKSSWPLWRATRSTPAACKNKIQPANGRRAYCGCYFEWRCSFW